VRVSAAADKSLMALRTLRLRSGGEWQGLAPRHGEQRRQAWPRVIAL